MKIEELFNRKIYRLTVRKVLILSMIAIVAGLVGSYAYANWTAQHTFTINTTNAPITSTSEPALTFTLSQPANTLLSATGSGTFSVTANTVNLQAGWFLATPSTGFGIDAIWVVTGANCVASPVASATSVLIPAGASLGATSAVGAQLTLGSWNYCIYYHTPATGPVSGGPLTITYGAATP